MPMIEEQLVYSFLTLEYGTIFFFKRSLSITKTLIEFYNETDFQETVKLVNDYSIIKDPRDESMKWLTTKTGKNFCIPFHSLEAAYAKNLHQDLDWELEFIIRDPSNPEHETTYVLTLGEVQNYLTRIHDVLLFIVSVIARRHGISIGTSSYTSVNDGIKKGLPTL